MVGLTRASGDVPESGSNALLCVAAGGDHAAIWIDSSSSAVIADDRRGTKSLRFDDCSLPKKCEIAVMGHDPVLLNHCIQVWLFTHMHHCLCTLRPLYVAGQSDPSTATPARCHNCSPECCIFTVDCRLSCCCLHLPIRIQQVVRDRSTAMMEKPLQQRIDHLQDAWGGAASGTSAADESSRDETFLLSLEAAQAAAGAAVEAEVPRATVCRSRSTNTTRAASPASARLVAARSVSGSAQGSVSVQPTFPKPARRSPARASPAQRHQSPRRPTSAHVSEASSTVPTQRVVALEGEVAALKTEVAAMREDMIGLRYVDAAIK